MFVRRREGQGWELPEVPEQPQKPGVTRRIPEEPPGTLVDMDPARAVVKELFRQIVEGVDIPAAESLLRTISVEKAAFKPEWAPYAILTNVAHADFWQQLWLDRLAGKRAKSFTEDWKTPPAEEWPNVRQRFLENLTRGLRSPQPICSRTA
jgi:hypothetical protein